MPFVLIVIFTGFFGSLLLGTLVGNGWCHLHSTGIFYDGRRDFGNAMCLTAIAVILITAVVVIIAALTGADWFAA